MTDRKTAKGSCYLIIAGINKGSETYPIWQLGGFHVRKTKPDLSRNEVAVKLEMELPVALFEKPLLKAGITIDGDVPEIDLTPDTIDTTCDSALPP